jgi:hypothetical protein
VEGPRVRSNAVAAGTALLGDWQQAQVIVQEDATLALQARADYPEGGGYKNWERESGCRGTLVFSYDAG